MARSTTPATAQPRWLDADEMLAWRAYVDSNIPLQHVLEADLTRFGLTSGDYEVLVRLSEATDRRLRMCDLAGQLGLSPSGLTRRLDGLVRNGLVGREPSPADRRVMLAVLTPDGYALLVKAAPHHVESVRRHFIDLLTRREIEAIGSAFAKVRAALLAGQDAAP
jgi:DNA-binding MarR family transcriptional regulator